MGKTAFVLSMARIWLLITICQPYFLWRWHLQLIRLISSETGLSSELRTGKLEKHEWEQLSTKVKNLEKHLFY
jgi:replicative DNA helicase